MPKSRFFLVIDYHGDHQYVPVVGDPNVVRAELAELYRRFEVFREEQRRAIVTLQNTTVLIQQVEKDLGIKRTAVNDLRNLLLGKSPTTREARQPEVLVAKDARNKLAAQLEALQAQAVEDRQALLAVQDTFNLEYGHLAGHDIDFQLLQSGVVSIRSVDEVFEELAQRT